MKVIALVVVLAVMSIGPVWAESTPSFADRPRITVNGEAVVNVIPDKIVVTFGIETWDKDIITAKQKNNDILKKALAVIKGQGIPEKEVRTDHLSITPKYENDYNRNSFTGYSVRNSLVVTLTETAKVEQLVTDMLQAGVNYIMGIDFQTSELMKYREKARELALLAAKEKAEQMAGVLGQAVGAPLQIDEDYSGSGYGYRQGYSQNVTQNTPGDLGGTSETIVLGKIPVRANVTVTFELKQGTVKH